MAIERLLFSFGGEFMTINVDNMKKFTKVLNYFSRYWLNTLFKVYQQHDYLEVSLFL